MSTSFTYAAILFTAIDILDTNRSTQGNMIIGLYSKKHSDKLDWVLYPIWVIMIWSQFPHLLKWLEYLSLYSILDKGAWGKEERMCMLWDLAKVFLKCLSLDTLTPGHSCPTLPGNFPFSDIWCQNDTSHCRLDASLCGLKVAESQPVTWQALITAGARHGLEPHWTECHSHKGKSGNPARVFPE